MHSMHEHDMREPCAKDVTPNTQVHVRPPSYVGRLFHSTYLLFYKGATDLTPKA